jgi:hypothetical protein
MNVQTERTLDVLSSEADNLKYWNPAVPCDRQFYQRGEYPVVSVSFTDDDFTACSKLTEISRQIPNAEHRLRLSRQSPELKAEVQITRLLLDDYVGPPELVSLTRWIGDVLHGTLKNWSLSESGFITFRRLGLLIYGEEADISRAEYWANNISDLYCFGLLSATSFREDFPEIPLDDLDLPALALTNQAKTHFRLYKQISFNESLRVKFINMVNMTNDVEMTIPYKYYDTAAPVAPPLATATPAATPLTGEYRGRVQKAEGNGESLLGRGNIVAVFVIVFFLIGLFVCRGNEWLKRKLRMTWKRIKLMRRRRRNSSENL